ARRAQLVVGQYIPYYLEDEGRLFYQLNPVTGVERVQIGGAPSEGTLALDAEWLNAQSLGALKVSASEQITVAESITLSTGGLLDLFGTLVNVNADITARSGDIRLGNVTTGVPGDGELLDVDRVLNSPNIPMPLVTVADNVLLDTRGLWLNELTGGDRRDVAWLDGGSVSLRSSGDVRIGEGAVLDVSSGARYGRDSAVSGGRGGDIR